MSNDDAQMQQLSSMLKLLAPPLRQRLHQMLQSQSESQPALAPVAPPTPVRLIPHVRYLQLHLIDIQSDHFKDGNTYRSCTVTVSNRYSQLSYTTTAIAADNAHLNHSLFIPLQNERSDTRNTSLPTTPTRIASIATLMKERSPMHIVITALTVEDDAPIRIASLLYDWRQTLITGSAHETIHFDNNKSLLKVDCRLTPLKRPPTTTSERTMPIYIEPTEHRSIIDAETALSGQINDRFTSYLVAWWKDMQSTTQNVRPIRLTAVDEFGADVAVTAFVHPIHADCLDTPADAVRFVRLITHRPTVTVGGVSRESWSYPQTTLIQRHGDVIDHCNLLCALLSGFGLNAYVCHGRIMDGTSYYWIIIILNPQSIICYDAVVGTRTDIHCVLTSSPTSTIINKIELRQYRTIESLYNHKNIYTNIQSQTDIHQITFDLNNNKHWRSLNTQAIAVLPTFNLFSYNKLTLSTIIPRYEEERMTNEIKHLIKDYRLTHCQVLTIFDQTLCTMMRTPLYAYEAERVNSGNNGGGGSSGNMKTAADNTNDVRSDTDLIRHAIKHSTPLNHTLRAFPFSCSSLDSKHLLNIVMASPACLDMIASADRLGVTIRVVAYPNDIIITWCIISSYKQE